MSNEKKASEDIPGAIEAMERRAAHLSKLVHPEPGDQTHRNPHWRDEVELKALRLGIKATKEYAARVGAAPASGSLSDDVLKLLTDVADVLELVQESGMQPSLQTKVDALLERLDATVDAAE